MINVNGLTKEFKVYKKYEGFKGALKSLFSTEYSIMKAVDDMSFHIEKGESVGYIGVNGAGKSTTIKMMTGILTPTSGECTVNGVVPYKNRKENAKNIGVVFGQRTQLWWDLPVSESMIILKDIYDVPTDKFNKKLGYLKELLGLNEFYLTPVRNLSLGQKMRADFAASLLHEPQVLFLDEPTIGLDLLVKDKIREAIREVNENLKTTVILTTHDLDDIEQVCKKIIVIDSGRKVFEGNINTLKKDFSKYKVVKFELLPGQTFSKNGLFEKKSESPEITVEDDLVTVKYRKETYEISEIITQFIEIYKVRDITVEEQELEEVIKEIYTKKGV